MSVDDPNRPTDLPERPEPPKPSVAKRWRYFSRRHAILAGLILGAGVFVLLVLAFLLYRLGFVDRYVAGQIKSTFANYGIRAEIKEFHATVPPNTVEMNGVELFDSSTGEKLGKIDRLSATIRIEDLYALNLRRNINLRDLKIEGFEAWVTFDEQGNTNFRNVHVPPPEPNARILFAYSTANVEVKNGVIHYGDARHEISGEGRNLHATIQPDNPNAPADSWANAVTLSLSNSTFTYDGRSVNNIDVNVRGRVNQTNAEIQEAVLRSPVAEAHLTGKMDDWRALRYEMNVTSSVDLTQLSDVIHSGTALRGAGNFAGTITGEGDQFKINGEIKSDALAADNLRLQGLNVSANGSVQGRSYDINGKAVADLLNAGNFHVDKLQLMGQVMGTGTDFRWVGELRAVAERSYGTTLTGLILRDARAEMNKGNLTASASQFTANGLAASGAKVSGITASDLRARRENDTTTATIANVKAGTISASGATIKGVTANNVSVDDRGGVTSVVVKQVQVGATSASGADIGSLNIAGVRLSIRNQQIQGSTADIDVGNVKLADGQADNVKLTKPVFVVEPSGSYRASADLSIGGGVLGQMQMGQARAQVVATNREIQFNNFTADVFNGRATGTARVAIARGGTSQVTANFNNIDIAGPLTAIAGSAVPLSGQATGRVDLTFPGTDFKLASGSLTTQLTANTATAGPDNIPINGTVALRADHGLFAIQEVNLQTPATHLTATGQFSFQNDSNLQLDVASTDAAEFQTVFLSSGLLPEVDEKLREYRIGLGGQLAFNGNIRGSLASPEVNGRVTLGSLLVNGTELGALSASIAMNETEVRVADGQLSERDGGGVHFSLIAPRSGENNASLDATLDRFSARAVLALSPLSGNQRVTSDTQGDISGKITITGIPNAMSGSANLTLGSGRFAGEPLEGGTARATFNGPIVNIESVDVRLGAGHIVASGNLNTTSKEFDLQGRAEGVQLDRLAALTSKPGVNSVSGVADFNAHVIGNFADRDFSRYQITFDGKATDVVVNGHPAGSLNLEGRTQNQQLSITLRTGILGQQQPQVIAAQINLASESLPATIETTLTNADLTNLLAIVLPNTGVHVSGLANGTIKASGNLIDDDGNFSLAGLTGEANFSALNFRVEDIQLTAATPLVVKFRPDEIAFESARFTGPGTNIVLDGTIASGSGGRQSLDINGDLNLRVLNGVSPDFFSSGTAQVAMRINGSFDAPRVVGTASVNNGSVSVLVGNERWNVANLKAAIRFTANQAQIDSFEGLLGGGRVSITGGALLEGFTVSAFRINVRGTNMTVPFPEDFRSTLDADVEIRGSSREQLIGGTVNLRRTEYTKDIELADIINTRRESIEEGAEIELTRTAVFAALRVEGRNALVVRNNLADLVGSVSLQLDGPVNDPTISGRITATSGTLNFRNDRYEITRALLDLPPGRNQDPAVNIQAESNIRGYRVIVSLTGPLSQPQAAVRSEPALPQADVVSLITTGQLSSGDTSTSVLSQSEVGAATSLLTDALINAPAQRATSKLFGLTRFEISPVIGGTTGSTPAARLTLGRRISKEVTVTYSTNVTSDPNQILSLEYRVSDRLSFIAQYEQASTRKLSARTNNFSFEIRFRKRF